MNILQITHKPPFIGRDGGSIAVSALTYGFSALGHRVFVLSMITHKHFASQEEMDSMMPENVGIQLVFTDTRIKWYRILSNLLFSMAPEHIQRFDSHLFVEELGNLLRQREFDVILLEGLYTTPYLQLIRNLTSSVVCYRAHNVESEIWQRISMQEQNPAKRFYYRKLANRLRRYEIKLMNRFDALIPITQNDKLVFESMGNRKPAIVIPAAVKIAGSSGRSEIIYPSVCYIGSLDWIPNQEGILWFIEKVWPLVTYKNKDLKFHIAGRNAPAWLRQRLKMEPVVFWGEVENAEEFLSHYAIMVVPLLSGSGMRVKILEGMNFGKAIVSTTLGATGIEVCSGKHILLADTAETFAEAIGELSENKVLFETLIQNASVMVRDTYDYLKLTRQLVNFFENMVL